MPQGFVTSGTLNSWASQGLQWGDPLCAAQVPSWLCLAGGQQPQRLCVWLLLVQPWFSAPVMLQGRLEILVLLWHEKQSPRGQSEGKLVFHTPAPLRVVAVFILQAETQEHDREWCHKTWPFFFGLQGPRAFKGSPGLAALVETTQQRDMWPHKGHGCSPATDCRHEQRPQECAKPHMLTHVLPGTGSTHTDVPVCRAGMLRYPCRGWTHTEPHPWP